MNGIPASPRSESAPGVKVPTLINPGRKKLTQARARELFDYREDGVLVWRVYKGAHRRAGMDAGTVVRSGHWKVHVDGSQYYIHRLVWLWHYGYLPEHGLDHINRKPGDNRIDNLREVSQSCNMRNTGNQRNNRSGVKGVIWDRRRRRWRVWIKAPSKYKEIGRCVGFTEAICHRLAAEQALDWAGCDASSPAYQYVKRMIPTIK